MILTCMNCENHPKKEASKMCVGCGNSFCDDCISKVKNKNYCKDCMVEQLEKKEKTSDVKEEKVQPQIIVQQQQEQKVIGNDGFLDKILKYCCYTCIGLFILYIIIIFITALAGIRG